MHKVRWAIGLNNGQNFFEEKGDYVTIAGELSPWNRLLKYISDNDLTITSVSLYTDDGRTFNLPSVGKTPKFHAFSTAEKPKSLTFYRKAGLDVVGGAEFEHYAVVEANFESIKLQLWVNESDGKNCWVLVTPAEGH